MNFYSKSYLTNLQNFSASKFLRYFGIDWLKVGEFTLTHQSLPLYSVISLHTELSAAGVVALQKCLKFLGHLLCIVT